MGFWDQLNTFKISSNPGNQIQKQSDPIHLEEENQDLLKSVKLVNDATLRSDGGIIPGTMAVKVGSCTDNGQITVIAPGEGEVWRVFLPIAKVISGSVSTTPSYQLWIKDVATSVQYRVYYFASTSSSPILTEDAAWDGEQTTIGPGQELIAEVGSFSATNINFGVLAGRVR